MSVGSDLTDVRAGIQQEIIALHVRNKLAQLYRHIVQVDQFIQGKVDSGVFNEIPVSIKQSANAGWSLTKQAKGAFEANVTLMEFINWYEAIQE